MTAPDIDTLKRLAEIDERTYRLDSQRAAIPADASHHRMTIASKERDLAEHREKIKKRQADSHNLEVDIQARQNNINKFKAQLNTAGTNKEYAALQHEIEIEKMELGKAEDAVLEIMADVETLTAERDQLEADLAEERTRLAEIELVGAEELRRMEADLATLKAARSKLAAVVAPAILEKYDRILKKNNGTAVAMVIDKACQGCHMTITHQEMNTLLGQHNLVFCRSCNRILYLPDDQKH